VTLMVEKVPSLYIASASEQSIGKTALCLGLALKFREEGLKVGYFKPLGWETAGRGKKPVDEDAALMRHALDLEVPAGLLAPVLLEYQYLDQYPAERSAALLEKVEKAYRKVSEGRELMILEALHEPCLGTFMGLSAPDLAKKLGSSLLLVSTTYRDTVVDKILFRHTCLSRGGARCAGVVFNRVREPLDERVKGAVVPALQRHGVHVWGLMPEALPLTAPTVGELAETLGGRVLCGEESLSGLVEHYLVGAMTQDSAIRYFRRAPRKAVITGGDRPDIALAALETDTSAIILTGDLYPNVRVLARAEEKGVPILLVPYDTYTTVERVRDITGKIRVGDEKRINLAKELVSEHVDWRGLLSYLGLARG